MQYHENIQSQEQPVKASPFADSPYQTPYCYGYDQPVYRPPVKKTKPHRPKVWLWALLTVVITAAAVAVSGVIGWVGLVVPHLARKLVGNNYRHLMPCSMLLGALFLLVVDNLSRNLLSTEIPLGILTAIVGAPFFIYLIMRGGETA